MTTVMTTADLYIAVKKADPMSYLMSRFSFSDESELFSAIRKVAPSKGEGFIKTLKKKQKKLNQRTRATFENSEETVAQSEENADEAAINLSEPIAQNSKEIVDEEPEQEGEAIPTAEESHNEEKECNEEITVQILTLQQLLSQENELSSIICGIEGKHKELVSKRREVFSRLERFQKALRELKRLPHAQEENVTKAYEEFLAYADQMEALNGEKKSYMKQLDDVRRKIDDMRKVNVFVYENASFEVENIPIEPIADSEVTSKSMKLFALPEAEELTAKEIKNIAKLHLVVEMIEANGYKAELVFDSERVQKFWETVIIA